MEGLSEDLRAQREFLEARAPVYTRLLEQMTRVIRGEVATVGRRCAAVAVRLPTDPVRSSTSTTQFYADQIEQLDLALDQLALRDRNFDRFAMLLVDNVVELTLHRHARDQESSKRIRQRDEKEAKLIVEATGQHFEAKVRLARAPAVLAPDVADAITYLHNFRNTAHHSGLRHEGILHSLALLYFKCACLILQSAYVRAPYMSAQSGDVIPLRSMKYLGAPRGGAVRHGEVFENAWSRLLEIADSMGNTLAQDLHKDLSETIDFADNSIQFLMDEGPGQRTRDQVIVEVQLSRRAHTEEVEQYATARMPAGEITVLQYHDWLRANYPWRVKADPVPSWRRRLHSLKREKNPHLAVKKYCDFLAQTEGLREMIFECGRGLDEAIQHQIDEARGK